jgi:hypothetical protein
MTSDSDRTQIKVWRDRKEDTSVAGNVGGHYFSITSEEDSEVLK